MLDIIRNKSQSFFVKLIFGLIIVTFVFLGVGSYSFNNKSTVATVNGEEISVQNFIQLYSPVYNRLRTENPKALEQPNAEVMLKNKVLAEIIEETMKRQEAEKMGLFVTPHELVEDLMKTFPFLKDEKGNFSMEKYKQYLGEIRFSPAQFEKMYMDNLLSDKLLALVATSVGITEPEARRFFDFALEKRTAQYVLFAQKDFEEKAIISEAAIADYYEKSKASFAVPAKMDVEYIVVTPKTLSAGFTFDDTQLKSYFEENKTKYSEPAQYKVKHIFLSAPSAEATDAAAVEAANKAKDSMEAIESELKGGATFEALATKYSDDRKSAENGGELNWMAQGAFPLPGFEEAALALAPNEVSSIIRTQIGFHIMKLVDKKPAKTRDFADVKELIKEELALQKGQEEENVARQYVIDELAKGTAFDEIAKHLSLTVEKTGLVDKVEMTKKLALPADSFATLENIPVGEVAPAPIAVTDGIALVKVLAAEPERTLTLEEASKNIVAVLKKEESARLALAAAQEARKAFTDKSVPAAYQSLVKTSQPFFRVLSIVPPLTGSQKLVEELSIVAEGEWINEPCAVEQGAVIARIQGVTPVTDQEWAEQGPEFTQNYWQGKQREAIQAFLFNLRASSEILVNDEALDSVRFTQ